jgi:formylglycine-generating enzyme required for sulfatase activity
MTRENISDFVFVAGGTLPAGSDLGELPVEAFYIGKTEVTWGEWKAVCAWAIANGYTDLDGVGEGVGDNYPVSNVSWYDVVKWCNARSEKEGKTPVYKNAADVYRTGEVSAPDVDSSANGYRLPSEEEWEFAARGGTQTNGYTYSGGNDLSDVGWYSENSCGAVHEVGNKIANELGIFDMSGNLREWTATWDADLHGILTRSVLKHGLPKRVGAKGLISQSQTFKYNDQPFAYATEESKGWIFVRRDDDGNGKPSYKDVDELVEVCRAIIEGTDGQSDLLVESDGERIVRLEDRDADVKSWEYEIDIDEDQFWDIIIAKLIETGELNQPSEGEEIDRDDINVNDFLYNYADQTDTGGREYSFIYGDAYMEFDDGFEIGMEMRGSNLHVHYYDSQAYQSSSRVLRGGNWGGDADDCAVVRRTLMAAENSDANSGFRVALRDSTPSGHSIC